MINIWHTLPTTFPLRPLEIERDSPKKRPFREDVTRKSKGWETSAFADVHWAQKFIESLKFPQKVSDDKRGFTSEYTQYEQ